MVMIDVSISCWRGSLVLAAYLVDVYCHHIRVDRGEKEGESGAWRVGERGRESKRGIEQKERGKEEEKHERERQ